MSTKKDKDAKNTTKKAKPPTKGELYAEVERLTSELESISKNSGSSRKRKFDLRADDFVDVISLCSSTLSLSTEGYGKGKIYTFTKFGERKPIIYSDVMSIIEHQMKFIRAGLFYIADKDVVKRHGLEEVYSLILTKEKMEEIIVCNKSSIELYETASKDQRKTINRILVSKLADGEDIDLNVVSSISRIGGKDLVTMAEEAKANKEN